MEFANINNYYKAYLKTNNKIAGRLVNKNRYK